MKTVLHTSDSRGNANHGWLQSHHTFSFAGYQHPERHHFGVLRVLNDDTVAGGMGFGTHPHRDMEIVSIPLEGDLKHLDNTGTEALIKNRSMLFHAFSIIRMKIPTTEIKGNASCPGFD